MDQRFQFARNANSTTAQLPWFLLDLDPGAYLERPYLVLDVETTTRREPGNFGSALDPMNDLVLACWKTDSDSEVREHFGGVYDQDALVEAVHSIVKRRGILVAHNAKYELQWLLRCGVYVDNLLVFDTQIAEYVLLGNLAAGDAKRGLAGMSTSLDACCRRRAWPGKDPVVDMLMKGDVCPSEIPREWLADRCRKDVLDTERLFLDQRAHLQRTRRLGVQYTRCLLTPVLAQIEFAGMHLDAERVEAEHARVSRELAEAQAQMDRLTGGINTRSSDQVAAFLYDTLGFDVPKNARGKPKLTKTGKRPTDRATIDALVPRTERQREFKELHLKIGKLQAALSKSLDFFLGVVRERDCIFSAQFNQTVTATHRLSSSGLPVWIELFNKLCSVQFQNLPREYKQLFCARNQGWLSFEVDGSQLEFRTAGHAGRDAQILADVMNPEHDAHVFTASVLNRVPYEQLYAQYKAGDKDAKGKRQGAKAHTFKPLYGGEKGTEDEERYYRAFRERYAALTRAQQGWVAEVLSTGRLVTEWGMRYYFPHAKQDRSGYLNVKSAIYNYPIQALATAEIIPIAVVHLWHRIRNSEIRDMVILANTVHDSAIGEVHPDAVDRLREFCIQAFTHDVYRYLEKVYGMRFTVPLGVGFTVGEHWGEGKEESYDVPTPFDMRNAV